ncbi:MAG: GNAT family N-acetyltransferase [Betaproteobacteria bacterium]
MQVLRTERLNLVAAGLTQLDAELESTAALGRVLAAEIPSGWPPGEYDRGAVEFFRSQLAVNPQAVGWYAWYAVLRGDAARPAILAGAGGFFGAPDSNGVAEIGYSIVPEFRVRGLATELVAALVVFALDAPGMRLVVAHTKPENVGSIRVLERCGFRVVGPGDEPGTVCYVLGSGEIGPLPWRGVRTKSP